jgi:hypothetical protein
MKVRSLLPLAVGRVLVFPMGVAAAGPAGAAAGTSCKTSTGTATITPGLGATAKTQTIVGTSAIGGCTGGGVTKGTSTGKNVIPNATCTSMLKVGTKSTITQTITWNTGKTSTLVGSSVTGPKFGQAMTTLKVTKGVFVGLHASQIIAFVIAKGGGSCTDASSPVKKLTVKAVTPLVIK